MRIWVKFQENWSGCLDHFLRMDTEWPFRDCKSLFIVLLGVFSAITREPLKVRQQVKHCKKGFCEIFQIGLTASYICTWNFWENPLFSFPFLESSWWFSKKFLATVLAFLQGLYLASSAFKDYTKSFTIVSGLGKNNVAAKKQIVAKKAIWKMRFYRFYAKIAADTGFRSAASEQSKNTTNKKVETFQNGLLQFLSVFFNFRTLVRNFLDHWHNFFYSHYFCFKFGRML